MQHGFSDPVKGGRAPRPDIEDAVTPDGALSLLAEIVGERKRVLDLGCGNGRLARLLTRRECDLVGIDINPALVEEARAFCTRAIVADIDGASLSELLGDQPFDVVVLSDVLPYLRQPTRLLDGARDLLRDGGYIVASIPNVSHGAIRLALLDGQFDRPDESGDESGLRHFTAKTIDELFVSAGYRIDSLQRTASPIFDSLDSLPKVDREDFDAAILAEVERDPEATTVQFIVRATPLTNDAKHRAIAKRFLTANTELSAALARLEKREREIERLTTKATAPAPLELVAPHPPADGRLEALMERAHRAEIEAARLQERLATDSTMIKDLARALDERQELRDRLASTTEELDRFREALTSERVAQLGTKAAIAEYEARIEALQAVVVERDALAGEVAGFRGQRDEFVAALARSAETTALLAIADDEIAELNARLESSKNRQDQESEHQLQALLVQARAQAEEIARLQTAPASAGELAELRAELAATRRSGALLADQLYDEIRLMNEARAIARAEANDANAFRERDKAALETEVRRLEDESRDLRLKYLTISRVHSQLEAQANAQIADANLALQSLLTERDAERAARIVGDEQHERLGIALAEARTEIGGLKDALKGADERYKALERRYVEQTRTILDQLRGEAARVELLISTVHNSVFWKIKRAFGRAIGR